jgi:hypothetical protein
LFEARADLELGDIVVAWTSIHDRVASIAWIQPFLDGRSEFGRNNTHGRWIRQHERNERRPANNTGDSLNAIERQWRYANKVERSDDTGNWRVLDAADCRVRGIPWDGRM